jgi:hypothetical protein
MRIVPQIASFSYSYLSFSSIPLLPAPPERKLLPAPQLAGLLCAPYAAEIIIEKPLSFDELLSQIAPIRSLEEMNAEIASMARDAIEQLSAFRARKARQWS